MDIMEAMEARHSVRAYTAMSLSADIRERLQKEIDAINSASGLHIQLVCDEPKAFGGMRSRNFQGPANYFAMVGPKGDGLDETVGREGEKLVLLAQQLGLNTCWVGMTFSKVPGAFDVASGEKLACVIALGYGATQGVPHTSKAPEEVSNVTEVSPAWFKRGVAAALLAPTAINQQKFHFELKDDGSVAATTARGFFAQMDLGIAKYHFELGAGSHQVTWA